MNPVAVSFTFIFAVMSFHSVSNASTTTCSLKAPIALQVTQGDKKGNSVAIKAVELGTSPYFDSEGDYFGPKDSRPAFPEVQSLISTNEDHVQLSALSATSKSDLDYVLRTECAKGQDRAKYKPKNP